LSSKASRRKTVTDEIIDLRKEKKKQYGALRQGATGVSSGALGGIGQSGGGQAGAPQAGFLKVSGDSMVGPLAYLGKLVPSAELPAGGNNHTLDLSQLSGESYSSYIIWGAGGSNQMDIIAGNQFTGQILVIESTETLTQTITDESNVSGPPAGNIKTLDGNDLVLGPRSLFVQFMYSIIDNMWHQLSNPIATSRWSEFNATTNINLGGFIIVNVGNTPNINDGICMGGFTTVLVAVAEKYNGTNWTSIASLGTAVRNQAGGGKSDNAISMGGLDASAVTAVTEEWNGSAWTVGGALATARDRLAGGGQRVSAICFGGDAGSGGSNKTEEYNGSAWTGGGNLGTPRRAIGGDGTIFSAISFGGFKSPTQYDLTEEYNGTSWAAGGALSATREAMGGGGNTVNAIGFGGASGGVVQIATQEYNGVSWSAGGNLSVAKASPAGGGNRDEAICIGGQLTGGAPNSTNVTEEYNGTAWSTGGTLTTATKQLAGGIN